MQRHDVVDVARRPVRTPSGGVFGDDAPGEFQQPAGGRV